jgi:hypothetical protein
MYFGGDFFKNASNIAQEIALTSRMRVKVNWEDMEGKSCVSGTIPALLWG